MQTQHLLKKINILPPELQKQVVDFIAFLHVQQQNKRLPNELLANINIKLLFMMILMNRCPISFG